MGESNKTLPPTEKKLEDARKEGNFLYAADTTQLVVLIFGLIAVAVCAYRIPIEFDRLMEITFRSLNHGNFNGVLHEWVMTFFAVIVEFAAIVYGVCAVFAIGSTIAQVGPVFQFSKIEKGLNFEQGLNVVSNAKNLFSKQSLATFLINVVKVGVISAIAYYVIKNDKILIDEIYSCRMDILCSLKVGAAKIAMILIYIIIALIPLAVLDWFIHYKIYMGQNMMSHDDLEREHKDSEGDPHMKNHRRQFAREVVMEDNFDAINRASAVVRNPTHVAIAVRYEPGTMSVPFVLAMGTDERALAMIAKAEEEGVPSYINVPLARGMLEDCEVGSFVPLRHMDGMVKFMHWLTIHHPERVYSAPDIGHVLPKGGVGSVKRG